MRTLFRSSNIVGTDCKPGTRGFTPEQSHAWRHGHLVQRVQKVTSVDCDWSFRSLCSFHGSLVDVVGTGFELQSSRAIALGDPGSFDPPRPVLEIFSFGNDLIANLEITLPWNPESLC